MRHDVEKLTTTTSESERSRTTVFSCFSRKAFELLGGLLSIRARLLCGRRPRPYVLVSETRQSFIFYYWKRAFESPEVSIKDRSLIQSNRVIVASVIDMIRMFGSVQATMQNLVGGWNQPAWKRLKWIRMFGSVQATRQPIAIIWESWRGTTPKSTTTTALLSSHGIKKRCCIQYVSSRVDEERVVESSLVSSM